MADYFGCLANKLPFIYLGVKVGANMGRINSWIEVVQKVSNKLSKWESKTVSMRGLWLNIIKSIHGSNRSFDQPIMSHFHVSVWSMVLKAVDNLKAKGVDLMEFCKKIIGNGFNSIWHDKWLGDVCFKVKLNKLFNIELHKEVSVAHKLQDVDIVSFFRRCPRGGIKDFQLQDLPQLLSSVVLSSFCDRWSWTLKIRMVFFL
ncbi:hypothetical protein CTI12_AA482410 [Artemisia annua]|uniref:RNA-directed DNA polymerase, eukaryota, Reverse transcriptase zinc-binding domain protein n=1 Tax=Artemisia annua TaxID=35608 RepID=A0A2U1LJY9_ARTAN|nr:hypothetical protein CTI12_AA482410 [Artemisia annua]